MKSWSEKHGWELTIRIGLIPYGEMLLCKKRYKFNMVQGSLIPQKAKEIKKMTREKMTTKQKTFCREYLVDLNAT
ncbi:terminase small subunit, partial [Xenorhabdus bovienii]|nr:terminase small subunit [Xenorhabdus bovienii]